MLKAKIRKSTLLRRPPESRVTVGARWCAVSGMGLGDWDLKGRRITDKRDVGCIGSRVGVNGTPTVNFGAGIQPREWGVLEGMKWAASAAKKGGTARFISVPFGDEFFL